MRLKRRSRRALLIVAPVCAALAVMLASCGTQNTPSILRPQGSSGKDILTLTIIMFAILSAVLLAVWGILAWVVVRYRNRPESEVSKTRGNTRIEIVWTVIPAVIVAVLFALTLQTTSQITGATGNVTLTVTGHQWWWEGQYSGASFRIANEFHVPVGRDVTADLLSVDVIHSFWIPQMGGKTDMIPGKLNHTSFTPVKVGRYVGVCSEFCGSQHAHMRMLLFVDTSAQYAAWFANQDKPAAAPTTPAGVAGAAAIRTLGCGGCHTLRGTPLKGRYGPDLTHLASRTTIAAVTLRNTPANLHRWISNPQAVKPGNHMPALPVPPQTLDQIVAYLSELK